MKRLKMLTLAALCFLPAACGHNPDNDYHYIPRMAGEVPATLHCKIVDIWTVTPLIERKTILASVIPSEINGKRTLLEENALQEVSLGAVLFGTPQEHNKITTFTLSPGPTTLTLATSFQSPPKQLPQSGAYNPVMAKLSFDAKPGETYSFNGGGDSDNFYVWIEDSSGKRVASEGFHVHYGPTS